MLSGRHTRSCSWKMIGAMFLFVTLALLSVYSGQVEQVHAGPTYTEVEPQQQEQEEQPSNNVEELATRVARRVAIHKNEPAVWWPVSGLLAYDPGQLRRAHDILERFHMDMMWSSGHSGTRALATTGFGSSSPYKFERIAAVNEYIFIDPEIPSSEENAFSTVDGQGLVDTILHKKLVAILRSISLGKNIEHYFQSGHDAQFGEMYIWAALQAPGYFKIVRLRRDRQENAYSYAQPMRRKKYLHCFDGAIAMTDTFRNIICPGYHGALMPPVSNLVDGLGWKQSFWYLDESERQWRMFRAHVPELPALEIFWSKESGGILLEHLNAIIEFLGFPEPPTPYLEILNINPHHSKRDDYVPMEDNEKLKALAKQQDIDYRVAAFGQKYVDTHPYEDEWWWTELGVHPAVFPFAQVTVYDAKLKTGIDFETVAGLHPPLADNTATILAQIHATVMATAPTKLDWEADMAQANSEHEIFVAKLGEGGHTPTVLDA